MKNTLIAAIFAASITAAHAAEDDLRTLTVNCFEANTVASMVEKKVYLTSRFYKVGFTKGVGHMAELVDPKKRTLIWFVFENDTACLLAVTEASKDDLKRVGLR